MIRNMIKTLVFTVGAVFILTGGALAEDPVFQRTHQEIVRELTRKPVKYRSFLPAGKKRSIVVMEKSSAKKAGGAVTVVSNQDAGPDSGRIETKTIQVVDNQDVPTARLKIEFDYNSASIRKSAFPQLKQLGLALTSNALNQSDLLVAGHTDSDGPDAYNLKLSLDRAEAVCQYLAARFNISPSRLTIRGYGEAMPLRPNDGPLNKQMNRRVEIQVR